MTTKSEYDFDCYTMGIMCASICTSMPKEEVEATMNLRYPTEIMSNWAIADRDFHDGTTNGNPCEENPETHKHYLMEC